MGDEGGLTVFGAVVLELMISRGVRQWAEISELLRKSGHYYTPQRMSNWAYGRHAADKEFAAALAEVLNLDAGERVKLAEAFAYGQDERIGPPG